MRGRLFLELTAAHALYRAGSWKECLDAYAKAPPTKPHGLDIRSRFACHTWDGKSLKLLPAKK